MSADFITFELTADESTLHVHGDPAGLRRLASILERLASAAKVDHDHLFTPEWGGNELSSEAQGEASGHRLLHSVTVHCWPADT